MGNKSKLSILSFLSLYILLLLFRLLLDFSYVTFISNVFNYGILPLKLKFDIFNYILSLMIYAFSFSILTLRINTFRDFFFLFYVLSILAPLTSLYGLDSDISISGVLYSIFSFYFMYFLISLNIIKTFPINIKQKSKFGILSFSWGGVVLFFVWSVFSGAIYNINFNPDLVYIYRGESSALLDVGIMGYLNLWIYKFFTIFLFVYYLNKRNFFLVLLIFIFQIYVYGVTTHKIAIFLPLLSFGMWFYFRRYNYSILLPISMVSIILFSLGIYFFLESTTLPAMIIRRAYYVPAGVAHVWFEFFYINDFIFWSNNLTSLFLDYPYDLSIPHSVGNFMGDNRVSMNSGYLASGYANAGLFGVIIYSTILAFIIVTYDFFVKKGVPLWIILSLSIGPIRTALLDSDLLTAILSHGIFISIIIFMFYPIENKG